MGRMLKLLVVSFSIMFLFSGGAMALNLGEDITINDERRYTSGDSWYTGLKDARNGVYEDNEVEPGMQTGDIWDLEGFFLNGSELFTVGTYNFVGGQSGYDSGDIFINIDGTIISATRPDNYNGNDEIFNSYGWDYVIDLDFDDFSYSVYSLNADSVLLTTWFNPENISSDPWRYVSGGTLVTTGNIDYYSGLSDAAAGGLSTIDNSFTHNAFEVDLGFLPSDIDFQVHFTMGCGNDNLMGNGTTPVPEPATMLLLGTGLLGIAGVGRKKLFKK
jgi:hypothetical protein